MEKTLRILAAKARAFGSARKGNVAMMFAIALVPIMIAAGAGLDLSRAMTARSTMSDALDAAALAVGSTPNVTQSQAQTIAQQYFNANYKGDPSYGSSPVLGTPSISGQSVTLSVSQDVNTTLLAVGGIPHVHVSTSSTVVWGQTKLWVTLVLDNTGSMTQTDSTGTSKLAALKTASNQLLTMLQGASTNVGDVQAAIVPFSKDVNVGTGYVNAQWIDWTDWESKPANVSLDSAADNNGPGSACPFTTSSNRQKSPYGYYCTTGASNGASTTSTVPSSGLICPGVDSGSYNSGRLNRYYNGCYNSVPTQTLTTTAAKSTPTTVKYNCTSINGGTATCTQSSSSTGSATTNTTTATTAGYSGDSGPTTTNSSSSSTSDGTQSCSSKTKNGVTTKTCTFTRTIVTTAVATTVTATGAAPYNHSWVVNSHSTWSGCLMDRTQNYDTTADLPSSILGSLFPAENSQNCVVSTITPMPQTWTTAQWTTLSGQINAMTANGSTNQTIGLDHGMLTQTPNTDPYDATAIPTNTTRYIILVSDGLNTQDRWYGDGSNQSTSVDSRMSAACTNAKAAGFVIYTVFVDLGGTQGNSTVLQNCASDSSKYYDLTSSNAIVTAFNQIGQQITALRVSH